VAIFTCHSNASLVTNVTSHCDVAIGTNDVKHFTLDFSYPIKTTCLGNVNVVYKYTSPNKHQYCTIPNTLVCIILCVDVGVAMYALRIVTNRIALNNQPKLI